ncbi:MAG: type II toxin-antitoxin system VapC family toxin [Sterolibacterium sp.]
MVNALFDTNILIDYLNAVPQSRDELDRFANKAISVITWMEVMVGTTPKTAAGTRDFLSGFIILPITEEIAERAVEIRQAQRIRLPDAIVWATAQVNHRLLVTRNTKDFSANEPGVRVPYSL